MNADLKTVNQDKTRHRRRNRDSTQALGATASKADIDAKAAEIKTAKYTDIESLMTKDTAAKPDEALLWVNLGYGQAGLKKYDDAITSYKKAIDLETASKKPRMPASSASPTLAWAKSMRAPARFRKRMQPTTPPPRPTPRTRLLHLRMKLSSSSRKTTPRAGCCRGRGHQDRSRIRSDPLLHQGPGTGAECHRRSQDATGSFCLPDCTAAYQKYLDLAPIGPYAAEVTGILQQAGEKVSSSYKAPKSKVTHSLQVHIEGCPQGRPSCLSLSLLTR